MYILRTFVESEQGAVTVDWTVLTGGMVGLGLATMAVVSGGVEDLAWDIRNHLAGIEISREFRDLIGQACAADGGPYQGDYQGMPVTSLLIYSSGDFVGGLPDEVAGGGVAGSGGGHALQLSEGARPIRIDIADDDGVLHELDNNQVLAQDAVINGETFGAGYDVRAAYNVSNSETGETLTTMHFGDPFSGYTVGPVIATAATNPLEPGETLTFDGDQTTNNNELGYDSYLTCS